MVVYVDNDPAVNAYGRALLTENDQTWIASASRAASARGCVR